MSTPATMLRVLFVDDDQRLLDGLRRALHSDRERWQIRFAASGAEALSELERETADVVISDMRMPGMDGATLLEQIAELHPHAVRVILSGQSDHVSALRSARIAHRFLVKPLPTRSLRAIVERFHEACATLPDIAARAMAGTERLPITQSAYENVIEALSSPLPSVDEVTRYVVTDVSLTATVLHLSHSCFFGQPTSGTSVADALRTIGLDNFRALLDGEQMRRAASPRLQPRVDEEQRRSRTAARIAARIARAGLKRNASVAALLGGAGSLLLAGADEPHNDQLAADLTAYLLGTWGIPDPLVPGRALEVPGVPSVQCLAAAARSLATDSGDDRISRECREIAEEERSADEVSIG